MIKAALLLFSILIAPAITAADLPVSGIDFTMDNPGVEATLYNKPGIVFEPDSVAVDSLKIATFYQKQGWFDCDVEVKIIKLQKSIRIEYFIKKGNRYRLSIKLPEPGSDVVSYEKLESVINYYQGKPAVDAAFENLTADIIDLYADRGYPYCEVRIEDIAKKKADAKIEFAVNIIIGPKVMVEKVKFPGRKNLEREFLSVYADLLPPFEFSSRRLDSAIKRLSLASFIDPDGEPQIRFLDRPEAGVLVIPVEEQMMMVLDGGLGYSSKNESWYGRFNAIISNIMGRGRQAELEWSKKDESSRRMAFNYREPYLFDFPINAELKAYQDDRDSLYIETGISAGVEFIISDNYFYGISAGISRVNPESYGRGIMPLKEKLNLALSFTADTRHYPANPLTGEYLFMEGRFVNEKTSEDSLFPAASDNYRVIMIAAEKYLNLTKSTTLLGAVTAQGDFSNIVPPDRQFPLGGFGSLRGYDQDFFYTSRYATGSIEYRLLTSKSGRAYIFTDMAVFEKSRSLTSQSDDSETVVKSGFGAGLSVSVTGGQTSVEIAIPYDDGFSAAKLHFGLKAGF